MGRRKKVEPRESNYDEVLAPGKAEIEDELKKNVTVQVKKIYLDLQLDRTMNPGEKFEVDRGRGEYLEGLGLVEILG